MALRKLSLTILGDVCGFFVKSLEICIPILFSVLSFMYYQYHYDTPLRLHLQDTHLILQDTHLILHHLLIHLKVPAEPPAKPLQEHFQLLLFTIWAQELQILQLERPQDFRAFKQSKVLCHHSTKEATKI